MIAVFTFIYNYLHHQFVPRKEGEDVELIDYFSLSTTLQSTVGLTDILPKTNTAKLFVNLQQILSIGGFAVLLYYLNFEQFTDLRYN
jgi:hypothetical protein